MEKKMKKEVLMWTIITVATFIITMIFTVRVETPEVIEEKKDVEIAYEASYNSAVTAKELFEKEDYLNVQAQIDEGRVWIKKLKDLTEEESPESIAGNTWSVILDNAQEGLFKLVEENIEKINSYKEEETEEIQENNEKAELLIETEKIIENLERSSIEKTQKEAKTLREKFEIVKNN